MNRWIAAAALVALPAGLVAQAGALDADVRALLDRTIAAATDDTDFVAEGSKLWHACAAVHGSADPLIEVMHGLVQADPRGTNAARLLITVLRQDGSPRQAIDIDDRIPAERRTVADDWTRADILESLGGHEIGALEAYDRLAARDLPADLRFRVELRRVQLADGSIDALLRFARGPERTADQRNQVAMLLGMRGHPAEALRLFTVDGEPHVRYRQLLRLCEWAIASGEHAAALQHAWDAFGLSEVPRDQRYALTLAVQAARGGAAIDTLLARFEQAEHLPSAAFDVWVDLLRHEGRVDAALRLFRAGNDGRWTASLRRRLLEICRNTGREQTLVEAFRELIAAEPTNLEWRIGLAQHCLEQSRPDDARAVWGDFDRYESNPERWLEAARAMAELGLDDLALEWARRAGSHEQLRERAVIFEADLFLERGDFVNAAATLRQVDGWPDPSEMLLAAVVDRYERGGQVADALAALERLRQARGGFLGGDLEMKYARLLAKNARDEDAFQVWRGLWLEMRKSPRLRYVEDRMMATGARLGRLADLVIEYEEKLERGDATDTDVELLIRLYVKAGDPASAAEIAAEFMGRGGSSDLEVLRRQASIYLSCDDYVSYEEVLDRILRSDPDNRRDLERELLLSRLQRGRRDQAVAMLPALRASSGDDGSADEFEGGVYQLAGMTDRALHCYVRSLGRHPEHIDTHLLVGSLMSATGAEQQALRRYQFLASTAGEDDLFTVGIDGILNLRANDVAVPDETVEWALRITLERLARTPERYYLYRLAADVTEELARIPRTIDILAAGVCVAGERRTAALRELIEYSRLLDPARSPWDPSAIGDEWDPTDYIAFARRLIGQGELVPPQVFMDLARVLLKFGATEDAMQTFGKAAELLDRDEMLEQAAELLADSGQFPEALEFRRRLLAVRPDDVGQVSSVAQLEELSGRDDLAAATHAQGLRAVLRRIPATAGREPVEPPGDRARPGRARGQSRERNVDAADTAYPRLLHGFLACADATQARALLGELREWLEGELQRAAEFTGPGADRIATFPRLGKLAHALTGIGLGFRGLDVVDPAIRSLLGHFDGDRELAEQHITFRLERRALLSARRLVAGSPWADDPEWSWLVQADGSDGALVDPTQAAARVVQALAEGPPSARALLYRVDTSRLATHDVPSAEILLQASVAVDAPDAAERIARAVFRVGADPSARIAVIIPRAIALATLADPSRRAALLRAAVEAVVSSSHARSGYLLSQLLEQADVQLDAAQVERWIRETDPADAGWGGSPSIALLRLLPAERRPDLFREIYHRVDRSLPFAAFGALQSGMRCMMDPLPQEFVDWYRAELDHALTEQAGRWGGGWLLMGRRALPSRAMARLVVEAVHDKHQDSRSLLAVIEDLVLAGDVERARESLRTGIDKLVVPPDRRAFGSGPPAAADVDKGYLDRLAGFLDELGLLDCALQAAEAQLAQRPAFREMQWLRGSLWQRRPGGGARLAAAARARPDDLLAEEQLYGFNHRHQELVDAVEVLQRMVSMAGGESWREELHGLQQQLRTGIASASSAAAGERDDRFDLADDLRDLAEIDDEAAARVGLRRLWRGLFPEGARGRWTASGAGGVARLPATELAAVLRRPACRSEVERMLRVAAVAGALRGTATLRTLLEFAEDTAEPGSRLRELSPDEPCDQQRILALLSDPVLDAETRDELLTKTTAAISSPDTNDLLLIARAMARSDRTAEAVLFYRMAALGLLAGPRADAADLEHMLVEIRQTIADPVGQAARRQIAEDVLTYDDMDRSPRLPMLRAALRGLAEMDDGAAVVSHVGRLTRLIERDAESEGPWSTDTASRDAFLATCAALLADHGALDDALSRCAELLQRTIDFESVFFEEVLPESCDPATWAEVLAAGGARRREWLLELARHVLRWHDEQQIAEPARVLGALAEALGGPGDPAMTAAAGDVLAALKRLGATDTPASHELVRVLRALHDDAAAARLEAELLAARRLPIADHARVIRAIAEHDSTDAALAAGETALAYTSNTELLETMIELAERAGQSKRAEPWREALTGRR